jgi:hypothetical protein
MVPRQQHHRQARSRDHARGPVKNMLRQAVAFERVTRKQHNIRTDRASRMKHTRQACSSVAAMEASGIIMVHMQVRTVDHDDVFAIHQ